MGFNITNNSVYDSWATLAAVDAVQGSHWEITNGDFYNNLISLLQIMPYDSDGAIKTSLANSQAYYENSLRTGQKIWEEEQRRIAAQKAAEEAARDLEEKQKQNGAKEKENDSKRSFNSSEEKANSKINWGELGTMTTIGDEATILNAGLVKISTDLSTTTTIAEESIFYAYGGSNEDRGGLSNQGEVGLNIGKLNISIGGAIGDELGINAGIGWGNEKITASVEIDQSFMISAGLEHDVVKGKYDNTEIVISEGVKVEAHGVVAAGAAWLLSGGQIPLPSPQHAY